MFAEGYTGSSPLTQSAPEGEAVGVAPAEVAHSAAVPTAAPQRWWPKK